MSQPMTSFKCLCHGLNTLWTVPTNTKVLLCCLWIYRKNILARAVRIQISTFETQLSNDNSKFTTVMAYIYIFFFASLLSNFLFGFHSPFAEICFSFINYKPCKKKHICVRRHGRLFPSFSDHPVMRRTFAH